MRSALVFVLLSGGPVWAQEEVPLPAWAEGLGEEDPTRQVLQNRKFALAHELALLGGVLPTDPYYKGLTTTVGYTVHLTDHVAWEVAQLTYSFGVDTDLKEKVEQIAGFTQVGLDFPEIVWVASSRAVIKPLYGKEAVFNTEIVHLEVYLQGGPALVGRSGAVSPIVLGADLGGGVRLWLTSAWSLRFEVNELLYFDHAEAGLGLHHAPHLNMGVAANLWSEE